jgi:hypothetical protein
MSPYGPTMVVLLPLYVVTAVLVRLDGSVGRYRSRSAAATTGSQSKPGWRVTVTKSFTP